MTLRWLTLADWRPERGPREQKSSGALRAAALLGATLLGLAACGALPYSGPPDPSTGESEHGRSG